MMSAVLYMYKLFLPGALPHSHYAFIQLKFGIFQLPNVTTALGVARTVFR